MGALVSVPINSGLDYLTGYSIARSLVVPLVCMLALAAWADRRRIAGRWRTRHLRSVPPVLDEDGNVDLDLDNRPLAARVLRPNGTVRVYADWSHR